MIRILTAAALIAATATSAWAADMPSLRGPIDPGMPPSTQGMYVGARGGFVQLRDTAQIYSRTLTTEVNTGASYEGSMTFSGFLGYDFGTFVFNAGARAELEVGTFRSTVNRGSVATLVNRTVTAAAAFTEPQAGGSTRVTYALANYYIDFDFGGFKPYVSVGLGMAHVSLRDHVYGGLSIGNDSAYNWAYQVGTGVSVDVLPNVSVEAGYRYLAVRDLNVTSRGGFGDRLDLGSHQALIGARLRF